MYNLAFSFASQERSWEFSHHHMALCQGRDYGQRVTEFPRTFDVADFMLAWRYRGLFCGFLISHKFIPALFLVSLWEEGLSGHPILSFCLHQSASAFKPRPLSFLVAPRQPSMVVLLALIKTVPRGTPVMGLCFGAPHCIG